MYQVQLRFYVIDDKVHCAAEYSRDYQGETELLASAHLQVPRTGLTTSSAHTDIFTSIWPLCQELAQNLEEPLF
jgi:hypothetical protein